MGFCSYCGTQWNEEQTFCTKCGEKVNQPCSTNTVQATQTINENNVVTAGNVENSDYFSSTGARGFVSPDEVVIYSLKNGAILNVISGEGWKNEDAIITKKRLYYNDKTGILSICRREEIVDLDDITGTKIREYKPIGIIVLAIIYFFMSIILYNSISGESSSFPLFDSDPGMFYFKTIMVCALLIVFYFFRKKSFLQIEYAGGDIRFSVKKYGLDKIRAFQRQIFTVRNTRN